MASCSYHPASLLWKRSQAGYRCQPVLIYLDTLCGHYCTTKVHIWNNSGLTVGIHALLLPAVAFSDPELCTHPHYACNVCKSSTHRRMQWGKRQQSAWVLLFWGARRKEGSPWSKSLDNPCPPGRQMRVNPSSMYLVSPPSWTWQEHFPRQMIGKVPELKRLSKDSTHPDPHSLLSFLLWTRDTQTTQTNFYGLTQVR